jgi:diguanylate cyclase (GGDEF)-like protein
MNKAPEQLLRAIPDWFIAPDRQTDKTDEHYLRATIILGVAVMSSCFALLVMIGLFLSPYPTNPDHKIAALGITLLVLLCYTGSLIHYKYRQTITGPSNFYATGVLFATTLPGLITGGLLSSPNLQIIIVVPVWAFLMAGNRNGLIWSAITILIILAYYIAEVMGVSFPQTIPESAQATVKVVTWLVAVSLVVLCLFLYEINLVRLTERLQKEQNKLAHEASHDSLTGLLNRKSLLESVDDAINAHHQQQHKAAILYIDLDNFKPINDTYGHSMGDEILTIVTSKLRACIKSSDTVARIGGDEFIIVLHNIEAKEVSSRISRQVLNALNQKIVLRGKTFEVSASIGVAYIPQDGDTADALISLADQAMYRAKRQKNSICFSEEV